MRVAAQIGLLLLTLCTSTFSATKFDLSSARKSLANVNQELTTSRHVPTLERAAERLQQLRESATQCEESSREELDDIDKEITRSQDAATVDKQDQLQIFLNKKRMVIAKQNSDCKIFLFQIDEAMSLFRDTFDNLEQNQRMQTHGKFWQNLDRTWRHMQTHATQKNFTTTFHAHLSNRRWTSHLLYGLGALLLSGFLTLTQRKRFITDTQLAAAKTLSQKIQLRFRSVLQTHLFALTLTILITLYTVIQYYWGRMPIEGIYLSTLGFCLVIYHLSVAFLIYFRASAPSLGLLPTTIVKVLARRLKLIGWITFITAGLYLGLSTSPLPPDYLLSLRTIFMTLFTLCVGSLLWQFVKSEWLVKHHKWVQITLLIGLSTFLASILSLEWLGYHGLTSYILSNIVLSIGLIFATWIAHFLLMNFLDTANEGQTGWQKSLRTRLGIRRHGMIPETIWLRIALLALLWGGLTLGLLRLWLLSNNEYDALLSAILDGVHVANIAIFPYQLILGLMAFTLMSLATRWLRREVAVHSQRYQIPGMQHSIAAIVGYVGFSSAFIISLLIAGINLTGLALIAGALSVGIGFGLQNIVNNFVSGLILLIERPIKPGDRVLVGEHEGFVKSISIRSTVVNSLNKMDIILPNSVLISGEVTNLMLDDKSYRLQILIGVSYDSDVDLVFETLTEIANNHPEVMSERSPSEILFKNHGDSALEFELRIFIRDVNKRQFVRSDINAQINRRFRALNIEIPYPQRTVHLRQESNVLSENAESQPEEKN